MVMKPFREESAATPYSWESTASTRRFFLAPRTSPLPAPLPVVMTTTLPGAHCFLRRRSSARKRAASAAASAERALRSAETGEVSQRAPRSVRLRLFWSELRYTALALLVSLLTTCSHIAEATEAALGCNRHSCISSRRGSTVCRPRAQAQMAASKARASASPPRRASSARRESARSHCLHLPHDRMAALKAATSGGPVPQVARTASTDCLSSSGIATGYDESSVHASM
mmetsp:Transcript_65562/g.191891  ORF Transcript_65562/g.191891 Transcript_65562/m.191891 type:complete len:229 (+) Transcript_65562:236-922(+)